MKPYSLIALMTLAMAAGTAYAEDTPPSSGSGTVAGTVLKVEQAVRHGAEVAADAVKDGYHAAKDGIETGANATARVVKRGVAAAADGVEHGADATARAANDVARKVDGSSGSGQ